MALTIGFIIVGIGGFLQSATEYRLPDHRLPLHL